MSTAIDLERLHSEFEELQRKESETKGALSVVQGQLKDYNISTVKEADKFIRKKEKEMKEKKSELKVVMKRIVGLLKK